MYTYIHTCLSLQYIPPSLPPSPLLHTFYYDIHIQPGILIGQCLQNSSKRYIRLALVSQPELQFNRSTAPPSRPQDLLKRDRERARETCLINSQTFLLEITKYCTYCTYCTYTVYVVYSIALSKRDKKGRVRNGTDLISRAFIDSVSFFRFVAVEGSRLRRFDSRSAVMDSSDDMAECIFSEWVDRKSLI